MPKEELRIAVIAAGAALVGSAIGFAGSYWTVHMNIVEARRTQVETNRHQAYMQIKGQQAEFLLLFQQLLETVDRGKLAQIRAAVQYPKGDYHQTYLSYALQQGRNAEHYGDEMVACSEKLFGSIALAQVSFPPSEALANKIGDVEAMLTRTSDIVPHESPEQTFAWAKNPDAAHQIEERSKERMASIQKAVFPITDLLNYLSLQMETGLP